MKILSKNPWHSAIRFGMVDLLFILIWFVVFVLALGQYMQTNSFVFIFSSSVFLFPCSVLYLFAATPAITSISFVDIILINGFFWSCAGYLIHLFCNIRH